MCAGDPGGSRDSRKAPCGMTIRFARTQHDRSRAARIQVSIKVVFVMEGDVLTVVTVYPFKEGNQK